MTFYHDWTCSTIYKARRRRNIVFTSAWNSLPSLIRYCIADNERLNRDSKLHLFEHVIRSFTSNTELLAHTLANTFSLHMRRIRSPMHTLLKLEKQFEALANTGFVMRGVPYARLGAVTMR